MVKPRGRTMSSIQVETPLNMPRPTKKMTRRIEEIAPAEHGLEAVEHQGALVGPGGRRRLLSGRDEEHDGGDGRRDAVEEKHASHADAEEKIRAEEHGGQRAEV